MKRLLICAAVVWSLFAVNSVLWAGAGPAWKDHLTKNGSGIAYVREPADYAAFFPPLKALPTYNPARDDPFQVDLRSRDISQLELASRLTDLRYAIWDSKTKWPAQLPLGFDPTRIMETSKNPGLGVRALHQQGITGKGVSIAIVDQPLLTDHSEYKDRIRLYEEIHAGDETSMHGPAVASIAVGKTVGVAPEADLYYIGSHHIVDTKAGRDLDYAIVARCIDRLLEVNRGLPKEKKIRVISMSLGWTPDRIGVPDLMAAIARAKQEGVFVLSVSVDLTHGFHFGGLGRDLLGDPDRLSSYTGSRMGTYLDSPGVKPVLWVPMDARATASPTGTSDYACYAVGGASWTIPYLAGLYALACQVRPDVTPEEFWTKAIETGDVIEVNTTRLPDPDGRVAKQVAADIEAGMTRLKQNARGKDFERYLAKLYDTRTGEKRDRMSEADFRAWYINAVLDMRLGDGKRHKLGNIVNPGRLMEALRKG